MEGIRKDNFDKCLQKLRSLTENVQKTTNFNRVVERRTLFWGLIEFDARVTGAQMNDLIDELTTKFSEQDAILEKLISELTVLYETIGYLDKEYISSIVELIDAYTNMENRTKRVNAGLILGGAALVIAVLHFILCVAEVV